MIQHQNNPRFQYPPTPLFKKRSMTRSGSAERLDYHREKQHEEMMSAIQNTNSLPLKNFLTGEDGTAKEITDSYLTLLKASTSYPNEIWIFPFRFYELYLNRKDKYPNESQENFKNYLLDIIDNSNNGQSTNIRSYRQVFFMAACDGHIELHVYNVLDNKLDIYESGGLREDDPFIQDRLTITKDILQLYGINNPKIEYWTEYYKDNFPLQGKSGDCGVFTMEFARNILFEGDFTQWSQSNIDEIRDRIVRELKTGQLESGFHYTDKTRFYHPKQSYVDEHTKIKYDDVVHDICERKKKLKKFDEVEILDQTNYNKVSTWIKNQINVLLQENPNLLSLKGI